MLPLKLSVSSPTAEVNRSGPLSCPPPLIPKGLLQKPGPHLLKAYVFTKGEEGRVSVLTLGGWTGGEAEGDAQRHVA